MMSLDPLQALAIIVLLGAVAQWLAWRVQLPAILTLLAIGFLVGPVTGLVDIDKTFGPMLRPFVSLAVALILFEGGLTLHFAELRGTGSVVRNLVTIGAAVTMIVIAAAAHWLAEVPLDLSLLIAAILVLTGPTVIVPLVRHIRPSGPVGPILRWEGILIDPIGAMLALLVFEAVSRSHESSPGHVVLGIFLTLGVGGLIGALAGLLLGSAIRAHLVPDSLHVPVALATVAAVFVAANETQHEAGLAGVTVLGMVLANMRGVDVHRIAEFKEDLGTVLLALLFVVLSARLPLSELTGMGAAHAIVVLTTIFLARPIAVICSTIGSGLSWRHRAFLMSMAPRGIVAAAVSSEFALRLETERPEASIVSSMVFAVIVGTVLFYGLAAGRIARLLGLAEANPRGVLFVGADRFTREMARVLDQNDVPVLLVDTNLQNVQAARSAGLRAWYGSILSERFFDEVDLVGLGRVLATTGSDEVNLLAMRKFRGIFDGRALYQLPPRTRTGSRFGLGTQGTGRWLFNPDASAEQMAGMMAKGATVKATKLTEQFGAEEYMSQHDNVIPLFVLPSDGSIEVSTLDTPIQLRPDSTVVSLVTPRNRRSSDSPATEPS
ncbi:MAG: sodium:proton antiporter [Planctomycetota bacterium]|nr:sodium:proton antiporter [Planctomycetota bacterium]